MKVAVMGGGSSYTPELINGFLERVSSFPLTELWLMDISQERLDVVAVLPSVWWRPKARRLRCI
jgi:6-phospho-beta-glucosidase